jgi:hypothetical protein
VASLSAAVLFHGWNTLVILTLPVLAGMAVVIFSGRRQALRPLQETMTAGD